MRWKHKTMLAVASLAAFLPAVHPASAEQSVRIATYNIRNLDAGIVDQAVRFEKLQAVVDHLGADVYGLQEIDSREALEALFPPDAWQIVIDDDDGSPRSIAVVVREPLEILNLPDDLDADDEHFLFPDPSDDAAFPERRDVLRVDVRLPDGNGEFTVLVAHAKSRLGPDGPARSDTDQRRIQASRMLVQALEEFIDDRNVIYVCDCNDSPDDQSANILETGNPNAMAGLEETPGPFMINLTEPLFAAGHVSHGRKSNELTSDRLSVVTIDPESRRRNHDLRGTNELTGDILFDQIYVSPEFYLRYEKGSAAVFDGAMAVIGNEDNRASDHLPVFADFTLGGDPADPIDPIETAAMITIAAMVPDPVGLDRGNEVVILANPGSEDRSLEGWRLRDLALNEYALAGTISAGGTLAITMTAGTMPLNNSGDVITLLDPALNTIYSVAYSSNDVFAGQEIRFSQQESWP